MERAPPELPNTSSRLIAMAVSMLGSAQAVNAEMRCSAQDFDDYRIGKKEPSWPELDRLVTLIVREQNKLIARNRELLARIRARRTPPA